uniref:Uncharacterized protein n=1 Tax=Chromera velia CCMP2878 TaxID=1169474 RepID=A0A0G4HI90_9ALVE|eukprot:Cvel_27746.t1-p1 / transcript=Cvel_27746.t1 / gene=Cvel_27746 / organism=Chromera_velia_CCMP2878 / gene_product=hypothetical protein / transcript_product=hypothetical protein / location=Cvel_scaffold3515:14894-15828(-) / protein_length=110 / sequence_SO=supercontig / SO=protein_coding / is_pseudo=false
MGSCYWQTTASDIGKYQDSRKPREWEYFHGLKRNEPYDRSHPHWTVTVARLSNPSRPWASRWTTTYQDLGNSWINSTAVSRDGTYMGLPVPTQKQHQALREFQPPALRRS